MSKNNEKSQLKGQQQPGYSINADIYSSTNVPIYSEDEYDESSFLNPQPIVGSFSKGFSNSPLSPASFTPAFPHNYKNTTENYNIIDEESQKPRGQPTMNNASINNNNIQEYKEEQEDDGVSIESRFEPHARKPFIPSESGMALRMRYYGKLAGTSIEQQQKYVLPAHVVPASLLLPSFPSLRNFFGKKKDIYSEEEEGEDGDTLEPEEEKKRGSITLIFSIWNTMMGSSLLALPWGFTNSGFIFGLIIIFIIGALCCYTCLLILKHGKESADFFYLCNDYLGKWGKYACWVASISMLIGAVIAYSILMTDVLYSSVVSIYQITGNIIEDISGDDYEATTHFYSSEYEIETKSYWNTYVAATLVFLFIYPISNMKSFTFIVMINTFGVIPIIYTVFFILLESVFGETIPPSVPLFESQFFVLAGLLSVSFYIHGLILPIMKTAKNPENNPRDLVIGYVLVGISYSLVGGIAYLYYSDTPDFPQEFLLVYPSTLVGAVAANILLLIQLATVFPLLLLIIRIQFFGLLWNSQYPGWKHIYTLNLTLLFTGMMFAMFYPSFGTILRFVFFAYYFNPLFK